MKTQTTGNKFTGYGNPEWAWRWILAELKRKGSSLAGVGRDSGLTYSQLTASKRLRQIRADAVIAEAVGRHVAELWPSRYDKFGVPLGASTEQPTDLSRCSYLSASQIAGLPGMPTTRVGVGFRAQREKWPKRPREGKGGGWEFAVTALPKTVQDALRKAA